MGADIPASSENCNFYVLIIDRYSRAGRTIKNSLLWNVSILNVIVYVFLGGYWVLCCQCLFEKYCKNRNEVFRFETCSLVTIMYLIVYIISYVCQPYLLDNVHCSRKYKWWQQQTQITMFAIFSLITSTLCFWSFLMNFSINESKGG